MFNECKDLGIFSQPKQLFGKYAPDPLQGPEDGSANLSSHQLTQPHELQGGWTHVSHFKSVCGLGALLFRQYLPSSVGHSTIKYHALTIRVSTKEENALIVEQPRSFRHIGLCNTKCMVCQWKWEKAQAFLVSLLCQIKLDSVCKCLLLQLILLLPSIYIWLLANF